MFYTINSSPLLVTMKALCANNYFEGNYQSSAFNLLRESRGGKEKKHAKFTALHVNTSSFILILTT